MSKTSHLLNAKQHNYALRCRETITNSEPPLTCIIKHGNVYLFFSNNKSNSKCIIVVDFQLLIAQLVSGNQSQRCRLKVTKYNIRVNQEGTGMYEEGEAGVSTSHLPPVLGPTSYEF